MLFSKVVAIRSYKFFFMVADDGLFDMGSPCELPENVNYFPSNGPVFKLETLRLNIKLLKERTTEEVMMEVFAGSFTEIGAGCGELGPVPARLIPDYVESFRTPRLLFALAYNDAM